MSDYVPKHRRMSRDEAMKVIEREIVAEMHRTEENIEWPTYEDYAADIARRLDTVLGMKP